MTSKKKAAGLDALAKINEDTKPSPTLQETITKPKSTPRKTKSFPLHLSLELHQTLREIAFHENTSMTKLILQGVDMMLKERGLEGVEAIKNKDI